MSKLLKYVLIVAGIILAVWFISAKIKSCNKEKDQTETNQPYVEEKKAWEKQLAEANRRADSAANAAKAFAKSADSSAAIKNRIEKDLFASKSRAERLASENERLKNIKDTSGQLANCDELAEETKHLSGKLAEYKTEFDLVVSLKDSVIKAKEAETEITKTSLKKVDSVYNRLYTHNQETYSQLIRATKKANRTVTISASVGYGIPFTGVIKPQPWGGITLSKTLIRLW